MTDRRQLHDRLEALKDRIERTRAALDRRDALTDGHRLTAGELEARYAFLKKQLDAEVADVVVHERHVSGLEQSVLGWLDGLDFDATRGR